MCTYTLFLVFLVCVYVFVTLEAHLMFLKKKYTLFLVFLVCVYV